MRNAAKITLQNGELPCARRARVGPRFRYNAGRTAARPKPRCVPRNQARNANKTRGSTQQKGRGHALHAAAHYIVKTVITICARPYSISMTRVPPPTSYNPHTFARDDATDYGRTSPFALGTSALCYASEPLETAITPLLPPMGLSHRSVMVSKRTDASRSSTSAYESALSPK